MILNQGNMRRKFTSLLFYIIPGIISPGTDGFAQRVPNDPLFPDQTTWHAGGVYHAHKNSSSPLQIEITLDSLAAMNLPLAWSITTGSRSVVVAVLDDGFFYDHVDIAANVWHNPGESGLDDQGIPKESNGNDDDGNGYVDDVVGWDFVFDDPDPDPYVFDGMDRSRIQPYWHSIHALGIIGAKGDNGVGIAGINWDVSMMLLKIGAQGIPRGAVDTSRARRAARAIRYASDNGARIINWSGFIDDHSPGSVDTLLSAIRYSATRNVLFVVGAGNDGFSLDDNAMYPQSFDEPNLLRVAQVALDGKLYRYEVGGQWRGSNFGRRRVELAAPGENFTTGLRNRESTYEVSNGTSNSGPVVAGIAALVLSIRPDLSATELKQILVDSGTPDIHLKGLTKSGRVVNALKALHYAQDLGK